jgi:hypothetical protein
VNRLLKWSAEPSRGLRSQSRTQVCGLGAESCGEDCFERVLRALTAERLNID